jgi:hypothetical protein
MTPAERVIALETEYARLKARADALERVLAGSEDEWLGIQEKLGGEVAEVTLNAPLAEARQTALAMATVLKTLTTLGAGQEGEVPAADPGDEVNRRREQRLKEAAARAAQATETVL